MSHGESKIVIAKTCHTFCMMQIDKEIVTGRDLKYLSVFINHLIHDKKNQRRIVSYVPIFGW